MAGSAQTMMLTVVVVVEGSQFVSRCLELGTTSCGDTLEEAIANIEEAVELHLEALQETGELERLLREDRVKTAPVGAVTKTIRQPVPA